VGREDQPQGGADPAGRHAHRVSPIRRPVPHPDVDRDPEALRPEARPEGIGLAEGQLVERRAAAHDLVVVRDLLEPGRRDRPAARHGGEEGADVLRLLRAAEGDQQDGVDRLRHGPPSLPRGELVHHHHHRHDVVDRGFGEDAVAEVEDVARPAPGAGGSP
jgi:hypothetical protein